MNAGGVAGYTEHHVKRVVAGEPEPLRRTLCDALEQLGYAVLSDNPIQAKREAQKNIWLADVLEYEVRVAVLLRPVSAASTVATFDYAVPYLFTQGDRLALDREADAIVALATTVNLTVCPSCGSQASHAARFCRSCGAPAAPPAMGELEVMRFTAGASAAQQELTIGLIATVLTLALSLSMILAGAGRTVTIGWIILAVGALLAAWFLQQGMRRLHRTINRQAPPLNAEAALPRIISADERIALPPQPLSVTEGTTKLVDSAMPQAAAGRVKDTGSVEQ
jgi:hypothetical protein